MIKFKLSAEIGEDIRDYAKRLIRQGKHLILKSMLVNETMKDFIIVGEFNGVKLEATGSSTIDSIVETFRDKLTRKHEEYLRSDEYIQWRIKKDVELKTKSEEAKKLTLYFNNNLDFSNLAEVLDWLKQIQPYTDRIEIDMSGKEIVNKLISYGYKEGENVGNDFDGENKENFARYIIGQCIEGLIHVGAIHPMCCNFINDWNRKFNNKK